MGAAPGRLEPGSLRRQELSHRFVLSLCFSYWALPSRETCHLQGKTNPLGFPLQMCYKELGQKHTVLHRVAPFVAFFSATKNPYVLSWQTLPLLLLNHMFSMCRRRIDTTSEPNFSLRNLHYNNNLASSSWHVHRKLLAAPPKTNFFKLFANGPSSKNGTCCSWRTCVMTLNAAFHMQDMYLQKYRRQYFHACVCTTQRQFITSSPGH